MAKHYGDSWAEELSFLSRLIVRLAALECSGAMSVSGQLPFDSRVEILKLLGLVQVVTFESGVIKQHEVTITKDGVKVLNSVPTAVKIRMAIQVHNTGYLNMASYYMQQLDEEEFPEFLTHDNEGVRQLARTQFCSKFGEYSTAAVEEEG